MASAVALSLLVALALLHAALAIVVSKNAAKTDALLTVRPAYLKISESPTMLANPVWPA
jgi:hypothetical protein